MSMHDAFLADICANPDDDTPRLVFADWLEDDGQSERAAFIRDQLAAHKLPPGEERWLIERRTAELGQRRLRDWFGSLGGAKCRFERGFPSRLTASPAWFLKNGEPPLLPLREVVVHTSPYAEWQITPAVMDGLRGSRWASRLTHLMLQSPGIGRDALAAFLHESTLPALEGLALHDFALEAELLRWISRAENIPRLADLELAFNEIDDEGWGHLLTLLPRLRTFSASRILRTPLALAGLAECDLSRLRSLTLIGMGRGIAPLRVPLANPTLGGLESLCLSDFGQANRPGPLLPPGRFPNLRVLELGDWGLDGVGLREICAALPSGLSSLSLHNNRLGEDGASILARCRGLSWLDSLDLTNCDIPDLGALALSGASFRVGELRFDGNPCSPGSAERLRAIAHHLHFNL
jgi:uncharacterized protein (TIGR02996 family)